MLLTGKIKTLLNTGAPDYNICGQASAVLDPTNMTFQLAIGKNNGSTNILVDTTDLSTYVPGGYAVYTYGNYNIEFIDFKLDLASATFQANIQVYYTGTTDVVTWERFNVFITIHKTGYQSYHNTFELYNYDVGNASGIGTLTDTTGNEDFELFLVDNTNNIDVYGRQTKVASKFLTLRRPFTNEIHVYNMIGTQGTIAYSTDDDGVVGYGNKIVLLNGENLYITQIVSVDSDTCDSGIMCLAKVWWPEFITSYTGAETTEGCTDCTNNLVGGKSTFYFDATNTSVFKIGGTPFFLSEFMSNKVLQELINFDSEVIDSTENAIVLTYALWTADPTPFLNPTEWDFIPDELGSNVLKIKNLYYYEEHELYFCIIPYQVDTCNFYQVITTEVCGVYTIKNCSANPITVVVQVLNSAGAFEDVSTTEIDDFDSEEFTFSTDGIYMLKFTSTDIDGTQYYSLPIFCTLQSCFLSKINETLCNKVTETNCFETKHYLFNALVINATTFFLLLNKELNYNFIYTSLPSDKISELYTMKTFIDQVAIYCDDTDTECVPCNQ